MHIMITGANRGIGATLARAFSQRGVNVTGTARAARGLLPLDMRDPGTHAALARALDGRPVDALVRNAGAAADFGEDEAARGLVARIDDLSPATSGRFPIWDGREHPV